MLNGKMQERRAILSPTAGQEVLVDSELLITREHTTTVRKFEVLRSAVVVKNDPTSAAEHMLEGREKTDIQIIHFRPTGGAEKHLVQDCKRKELSQWREGDAKVDDRGEEETAVRPSKDVDNSGSEKWHDASLWSVGSTALGRGLQMTPGRPGYQVFISYHLSRRVSEESL